MDGEVGGGGVRNVISNTTRYAVTTRMILHSGGQLYEPF